MNEATEFLNEVQQQRDLFTLAINEQSWNTEMRTSAESLLIMYDQMVQIISEYSLHPNKS